MFRSLINLQCMFLAIQQYLSHAFLRENYHDFYECCCWIMVEDGTTPTKVAGFVCVNRTMGALRNSGFSNVGDIYARPVIFHLRIYKCNQASSRLLFSRPILVGNEVYGSFSIYYVDAWHCSRHWENALRVHERYSIGWKRRTTSDAMLHQSCQVDSTSVYSVVIVIVSRLFSIKCLQGWGMRVWLVLKI